MNKDNLTPATNEGKKPTVDKKSVSTVEKKNKKQKRVYSIEEILAEGGKDPNAVDEHGKKQKIRVKTKSKLKRKEAAMGYVFILPWLIGMGWLTLFPMFQAIRFSVYDVLIAGNGLRMLKYVGIQNYKDVLQVYQVLPQEITALVWRMVLTVPTIVVFALLMAMLLNLPLKGKGVFRTIFFLPVIVVSGPVMAQLSGDAGTISAVDLTVFSSLIADVLPMSLATAVTDLFSQIIMVLWYGGVQILIFLAALQKIDTSLYEAAKIDGGSGWECFWKITLPTIKPMILLNAVYTIIFLASDENSNRIITYMAAFMIDPKGGIDRNSALGLMYSAVILLIVAVAFLLLKNKRDVYDKQIAKRKRFERKTRRSIAKSHKHMIKNAKKYDEHVANQEKARLAGKKVKGGERLDD